MWHPAHVDGRTLVVIRHRKSLFGGFDVVESGRLQHDGKLLELVGDHGSRVLSKAELNALQLVVPQSRIKECQGFDFSLIQGADAEK